MMNWLWLGAAVVFGLIEAATAALVSVWFVGGAVAALLVSLLATLVATVAGTFGFRYYCFLRCPP